MKLLPTVLSLIAGSVDAITFLGLGGLFTAHITGNLVILAAHLVSGGNAEWAPILSVPVFVAVLGLTRLLASKVEEAGIAPAGNVEMVEPLGYLEILALVARAVTVVTDSGGLQNEAYWLVDGQVP